MCRAVFHGTRFGRMRKASQVGTGRRENRSEKLKKFYLFNQLPWGTCTSTFPLLSSVFAELKKKLFVTTLQTCFAFYPFVIEFSVFGKFQ